MAQLWCINKQGSVQTVDWSGLNFYHLSSLWCVCVWDVKSSYYALSRSLRYFFLRASWSGEQDGGGKSASLNVVQIYLLWRLNIYLLYRVKYFCCFELSYEDVMTCLIKYLFQNIILARGYIFLKSVCNYRGVLLTYSIVFQMNNIYRQ